MARVFISYRRADGQYAVGWLQERLQRVASVTDIDIAFRDADLLCGDDYVSALVHQVEEADVLIVVIGPQWHGRSDDGRARILDPNDWVAREISTALADDDKLIMPLLIDGAEPLSPDDLLPEHAELARMHAVRFEDDVGLDEFVGDLETQLERIDHRRAMTRGLDAPIAVASILPTPRQWLLMAVAALVIGGLRLLLNTVDSIAASHYDGVAIVYAAVGGAIGVYLASLAWDRLRPLAEVQTLPVLISFAVAGGVMFWLSVVDDNLFAEGPEGWNLVALALLTPALLPAAYIVLGLGWMERRMADHELGQRVVLVATHNKVVIVTAVLISLWAALGVWSTQAVEDRLFHVSAAGTATLIIIAAVVWARTRLERESVALEAEVASLAPTHRQHARDHFVVETLTTDQTWLAVVMVLPAICGVIRAITLP